MTKNLIHYQNASLFSISVMSLFIYIYNCLIVNPINIYFLQIIILIYSFIDLFLTNNNSSKFHHIFSIIICYYCLYYNLHSDNSNSNNQLPLLFLKTETTSIFLILTYYINEKSVLYIVNGSIFYILFLKIRIIEYYSMTFDKNSNIYLIINKYSQDDKIHNYIFLYSFYGLFMLNIYWFLLINKKFYNKILLKQ